MIKNHVFELINAKFAAEHKQVNLLEVSRETVLKWPTVQSWYKSDLTRFDTKAIDAWCAYLNVGVGDILEYLPSEGDDHE